MKIYTESEKVMMLYCRVIVTTDRLKQFPDFDGYSLLVVSFSSCVFVVGNHAEIGFP